MDTVPQYFALCLCDAASALSKASRVVNRLALIHQKARIDHQATAMLHEILLGLPALVPFHHRFSRLFLFFHLCVDHVGIRLSDDSLELVSCIHLLVLGSPSEESWECWLLA